MWDTVNVYFCLIIHLHKTVAIKNKRSGKIPQKPYSYVNIVIVQFINWLNGSPSWLEGECLIETGS